MSHIQMLVAWPTFCDWPRVQKKLLSILLLGFNVSWSKKQPCETSKKAVWHCAQVEPAAGRLLKNDRPRHLPALLDLLERFALPQSPLPDAICPHLSLLIPPLPKASGDWWQPVAVQLLRLVLSRA